VDLQFSVEDARFRDEARGLVARYVPRERRPHAGEAMRAFDTRGSGGNSKAAGRVFPGRKSTVA